MSSSLYKVLMLIWLKLLGFIYIFESVSLNSFARYLIGINSSFIIFKTFCLGVSEVKLW